MDHCGLTSVKPQHHIRGTYLYVWEEVIFRVLDKKFVNTVFIKRIGSMVTLVPKF